jgi:solute carrier family 45 protein 1/2/4
MHNLFISVPQIIMTSTMGIIWTFSGPDGKTGADAINVVWFLRLGGLFALGAMYLATWIDDPVEEEKQAYVDEMCLREM